MATTPALFGLKQLREKVQAQASEPSVGQDQSFSSKLGLFKSQAAGGSTNPADFPTSSGSKLLSAFKSVTTASPSDALTRQKRGGLRQSVTAMINVRRLSRAFGLLKKPGSVSSSMLRPVVLENTYKMAPDEGGRFSTSTAKRIIDLTLAARLKDVTYDPSQCKTLAADLSMLIRDRIKALNYPRYKIICHVMIGEKKDQGLEVASRSLWSSDTDTWASATFTNDSLFAVATVHATYFE